MHNQESCPDLDNCHRCKFRHQFTTEADWILAVKAMNRVLDVGGFPPVPHLRVVVLDLAIQMQLTKQTVPASPDVAEAQARANGGDQ